MRFETISISFMCLSHLGNTHKNSAHHHAQLRRSGASSLFVIYCSSFGDYASPSSSRFSLISHCGHSISLSRVGAPSTATFLNITVVIFTMMHIMFFPLSCSWWAHSCEMCATFRITMIHSGLMSWCNGQYHKTC